MIRFQQKCYYRYVLISGVLITDITLNNIQIEHVSIYDWGHFIWLCPLSKNIPLADK